MTKAEEVFEKVEAMTASGEVKKADAFKQLAEQYGQPVDSIRGSYYSHKRAKEGGNGRPRRTRRRETTTEVAVESATAALQRAIDNIDVEIEAAKQRADEAKAEYDSMKGSAAQRKKEIEAKIAALEAAES